MDIFTLLRALVAPRPATPVGMNQPDLDQIDLATGQLTPGGVAPAAVTTPAPPNGGTARPQNAQEAAAGGNPQVLELLRRREGGFGAVPQK